jgi:hypothetical protein
MVDNAFRLLVTILRRIARIPRLPSPRRRVIPIAIGVTFFGVAMVPNWLGWMSDRTADILTIILSAVGFGFKAAEYLAMRRRMTTRGQKLSVFGLALIDWFTGLAILSLVMTGVFLLTYYYAVGCDLARPQTCRPPLSLQLFNRAAIDGAVAFVVATGAAAWWEMRRAGDYLSVHTDEWDERTERRRGERRASTVRADTDEYVARRGREKGETR